MKLCLSLILVLLLFANYKQVSKKPSNLIEISFGKGGGITGLLEKYRLTKNRVLWKYDGTESSKTFIKTIPKDKHQYIIKKILNKSLLSINLNKVGNMTCFIELSKGLKVYKKFQWPIEKTDIPVQIIELDSLLRTIL
jgi:hypothetical protein